jgi:hypothetical protein
MSSHHDPDNLYVSTPDSDDTSPNVSRSAPYTHIEVQPNETRPTSSSAEYSTKFEAKLNGSKRHYFPATGENITFYNVDIKRTRTPLTGNASPKTIEYTSRKRYSQFLDLKTELEGRHSHLPYEKFPPKRYDSEADETIRERLIGLDGFIEHVLKYSVLSEDPAVIAFFSPEPLGKAKQEAPQRTWFDTFIDYASLPFIALENKFNTDRMVRRHPEMFAEQEHKKPVQ